MTRDATPWQCKPQYYYHSAEQVTSVLHTTLHSPHMQAIALMHAYASSQDKALHVHTTAVHICSLVSSYSHVWLQAVKKADVASRIFPPIFSHSLMDAPNNSDQMPAVGGNAQRKRPAPLFQNPVCYTHISSVRTSFYARLFTQHPQ